MIKQTIKLPTWPYFAADEIEAVNKILRSGKVNYWTGEECKLFEKEFADFIEVPYAISLANGTVALELALRALGIGKGDDVIVPCRTFIATASCVVACQARPIMADIDLICQNITVDTIARALTPKTKAIILVHLAGWSCEMDAILEFAAQHNLKIIEDCAQAHGATYKGKHVGSFGDMAAFSFCQDKIMTTGGEGGMLVTRDKDLWEKSWSYKDHGKNPNKKFTSLGSFCWRHDSFGSNFRLTEMQAAIGRMQLRKLPNWLDLRRCNAKTFTDYFNKISGFRVTMPPEYIGHAYYKYYVFIEPEALQSNWSRDRILREISADGIPCGSGSCGEIYLEKAFVDVGLGREERFPNAKLLSETSLTFLVHPTLNESDLHKVIEIIGDVMKKAVR